MAIKFYSDIKVPKISTTNINASTIYAVDIGTEDTPVTNIQAENIQAEKIGDTGEDKSVKNIYAKNIQATNIQSTYIGSEGKSVNTIYADNIGTKKDAVNSIIANTIGVNGFPVTHIYAGEVTDPSGWNYKDKNTKNLSYVINDIDTRLSGLGFNDGGKISMSINDAGFIEVGSIYKLGDVFYGKTSVIPYTPKDNNNKQIEFIKIQINLPTGINRKQVTALQIFPPQIMETAIHYSGTYNREPALLLNKMEYTTYQFQYDPQASRDGVVYGVELSECIILGTTNSLHALP